MTCCCVGVRSLKMRENGDAALAWAFSTSSSSLSMVRNAARIARRWFSFSVTFESAFRTVPLLGLRGLRLQGLDVPAQVVEASDLRGNRLGSGGTPRARTVQGTDGGFEAFPQALPDLRFQAAAALANPFVQVVDDAGAVVLEKLTQIVGRVAPDGRRPADGEAGAGSQLEQLDEEEASLRPEPGVGLEIARRRGAEHLVRRRQALEEVVRQLDETPHRLPVHLLRERLDLGQPGFECLVGNLSGERRGAPAQGRAALRKPGNGSDELFLCHWKSAGKELVPSLSEFHGETLLLGGEEVAQIAHGLLGVRHGLAQGFDPALRLLDGEQERLPPLLDLFDDPGAQSPDPAALRLLDHVRARFVGKPAQALVKRRKIARGLAGSQRLGRADFEDGPGRVAELSRQKLLGEEPGFP